MKKLINTLLFHVRYNAQIILFLFLISPNNTYAQDYLVSVTSTGTGTTTDNSQAWTDVTSVIVDVTGISNLLVSATINMRPDGSSTQGREGNYNIYRLDDPTDNSGVIKRQIKAINEATVESWGIGTLVHIFDVSGLTGDQEYVIEHSNKGGSSLNRNVYSSIRLNAVALTTAINSNELNNSVKRLDDPGVTTTSSTYAAVTGLTTDVVTLPVDGNIFVMASINGKADDVAVAEYKIQSSDDNVIWDDLGTPVKRSMVNQWDDGIVTLTGLLQGQPAGDYFFRVAHKRISGPGIVTTHYSNLVAFALTHIDGEYRSFYSEVGAGIDITGESTSPAEVTSSPFTTTSNISGFGPKLFVSAQYLVSASNLNESAPERMRAGNQLFFDDGTTKTTTDKLLRYIPENSNFGSGGFIGLTDPLLGNTAYTVGMQHDVVFISAQDGTLNETLTTSSAILQGFQTYEESSTVPIELLEFKANNIDNKVKLEWTTVSEINNDYFTVERSVNAVDWNELDKHDGAGNSSSLLSYELIDNSPLSGMSYYRLKQTDYDGQYSYSQIRRVSFSSIKDSEVSIFPNPTKGQITIVGIPVDIEQVKIYNMSGQDLTKFTKQVCTLESKLIIDLSDLQQGFYSIITKNTASKVYKQ